MIPKTFALVLHTRREHFYNETSYIHRVLMAASLQVQQEGATLLILSVNSPHLLYYIQKHSHEFAGIIHFGPEMNRGLIRELASLETPQIMIDDEFSELEVDCVIPDSEQGAFLAVEQLARLGHTRIGYLGARNWNSDSRRNQGFIDAMERFGLSVVPEYTYGLLGDPGVPHRTFIRELQFMRSRPTAFYSFFASDSLLQEFEAVDLHIPTNLSLIGTTMGEYRPLMQKISSVNVSAKEMVRQSLELLKLRRRDPKRAPEVRNVEFQWLSGWTHGPAFSADASGRLFSQIFEDTSKQDDPVIMRLSGMDVYSYGSNPMGGERLIEGKAHMTIGVMMEMYELKDNK